MRHQPPSQTIHTDRTPATPTTVHTGVRHQNFTAFPTLITPTIRHRKSTTPHGIHSGDSTHHHDQSMLSVTSHDEHDGQHAVECRLSTALFLRS
jgi:hypothetical protein